MRLILLTTLLALHAWLVPALAADYYLNDRTGNDEATGATPETAWQSIARLERQPLAPGDVVHFAAGGVWRQSLTLRQGGAPGRPITYIGQRVPNIAAPVIVADREYCVDASASHVTLKNLQLVGAKAKDRGAIMIWADRDLTGITIDDCNIYASAGRGIWIAGDAGKAVTGVTIHNNAIHDNAGSGILVARLARSRIERNSFYRNCREEIDPWQAAIRVWSNDVHDLAIERNTIRHQRFFRLEAPGMGIHVDEVGPNVSVTANDIQDCDGDGIVIENTAGVRVRDNIIKHVPTGIFIYRAGHDLRIERNSVAARDLGIVLQGHHANGINAGPEIEKGGKLFSGNIVTGNKAKAERYASLKCIGGAERADTRFNANDFGPDRLSMFEWGDRQYNSIAAFISDTAVDLAQADR